MNAQTEIKATNIFIALAAARSSMPQPKKSGYNTHFKTKYPELSDVIEAAQPSLNENGICFFFQTVRTESGYDEKTVLVHGESGTSIENPIPILASGNNAQNFKTGQTYSRRMGLSGLCGFNAEVDTDGGGAGADTALTVTPEQFIKLRDAAEQAGVEEAVICKAYNATSFEQFPADKFPQAMKRLEKTVHQRENSHA